MSTPEAWEFEWPVKVNLRCRISSESQTNELIAAYDAVQVCGAELATKVRRQIQAELERRATLGGVMPPPAGDGKVGES